MANTDGLEYKVPRQFEAKKRIKSVVIGKKLTGLTLEGDTYSKCLL